MRLVGSDLPPCQMFKLALSRPCQRCTDVLHDWLHVKALLPSCGRSASALVRLALALPVELSVSAFSPSGFPEAKGSGQNVSFFEGTVSKHPGHNDHWVGILPSGSTLDLPQHPEPLGIAGRQRSQSSRSKCWT